jgi:hypothetical protein
MGNSFPGRVVVNKNKSGQAYYPGDVIYGRVEILTQEKWEGCKRLLVFVELATEWPLMNVDGILLEFHWNFRRWGLEFQKSCMHF